jgi:acyl-CoA synthetase (NDP forming)
MVTASETSTNIDALVKPGSIAIIGASRDPDRLGGRPLALLKKTFSGALYPVNSRQPEVQGLPSYPSVLDLPETPDLALVLVAADDAVAAAEDAARRGARAAIVFSSGFAEAGGRGAELQARLTAVSRQTGMRILGPNTNGLLAIPNGTLATFAGLPEPPLPVGPVAVVSQSGAFGMNLFLMARQDGLPFGYVCGTGNEADLTVAQMLEYLVERPDVSILIAYAESIAEAPRLIRVADRARHLGKPLLFLKAGRSRAGERGALSHTASIAGSDAAVDAVFAQHGILRAYSVEQLLRWVAAFSSSKRPRGPKTGILTASGGMGIVLADTADELGLEVPELGPDSQSRLRAMLPEFAGTSNPVDVTGQIVNDAQLFDRALDALAGAPEIDLLLLTGVGGRGDPAEIERARQASEKSDKPFIVWTGDPEASRRLRAAGIPAYRDSGAVVDAAAALVRYASFRRVSPALPSGRSLTIDGVPHERGLVLDHHARQFLAAFGVPPVREQPVPTSAAAVEAARAIGYPVALKALSYDYVHKTEAGAIRLGLSDDGDLVSAFDEMAQRAAEAGRTTESFLVQEMAPPGLELIVGARRDVQFGPIVSIGIGGSLVEIIAEVSSRPAPLSRDDAYAALAELCGGRLITSKRGLTAEQQGWVADVMIGVGQAAVLSERILEVDLNPVIVAADGLYVVDAAIVLSAADDGKVTGDGA